MGVDLNSYRAAVGIFYLITHRRLRLPESCWNLPLCIYCLITCLVLLFVRGFIKNDEFVHYRMILLLMAMDIELNPGPSTSESVKVLEIFHLNTRSVRNKLEYISDIAESFHVLCFSETHLDNTVQNDLLKIQGFDEPLRKDRNQNGGGVMVYVSNALRYKRRKDLEDSRLETIWVEIDLKSFKILICCFYRSDFNASQSFFY